MEDGSIHTWVYAECKNFDQNSRKLGGANRRRRATWIFKWCTVVDISSACLMLNDSPLRCYSRVSGRMHLICMLHWYCKWVHFKVLSSCSMLQACVSRAVVFLGQHVTSAVFAAFIFVWPAGRSLITEHHQLSAYVQFTGITSDE